MQSTVPVRNPKALPRTTVATESRASRLSWGGDTVQVIDRANYVDDFASWPSEQMDSLAEIVSSSEVLIVARHGAQCGPTAAVGETRCQHADRVPRYIEIPMIDQLDEFDVNVWRSIDFRFLARWPVGRRNVRKAHPLTTTYARPRLRRRPIQQRHAGTNARFEQSEESLPRRNVLRPNEEPSWLRKGCNP